MKRILAILVAILTLAAFASCGKAVDTSATTAAPDLSDETEVRTFPEEETTLEEETEEGATEPVEETTLEEETTAEAATTMAETTTEAPTTVAEIKTPTGTADIVAFYNTAANNTKAQKDFTVTRKNKLDCNITEGVLTIVNSVLSDLREDTEVKEVFKNGKGTIDTGNTPAKFLPPRPGEFSYMSKLQASGVKSASCVKNADGTFTVNIALKEETFKAKSEKPKNHHSCMGVLDIDWNGLPFSVHDDTTGRNYNGTIKAVITPDGQLLKELHQYQDVEVKGQVQVIVWANITVQGYYRQDFIFS